MIRQKYIQIFIHITAWFCFISLPFYFSPKPPDNFHQTPNDYFYLSYLFTNFLLIGFYYLNSELLIPKLLARRKILYYLLSIVALFFIIVVLPEFIKPQHEFEGHGGPGPGSGPEPKHIYNGMLALMFFFIFIISSGIKIINKWFESEKTKTLIEKEKLQTELSNLKAQINPHFLFNVLNTIYALSLKKSDDTPSAVMQLSKLLRYIVNETQADKVPLEKEINCIDNYIDLQKMRISETVEITYKKTGTFTEVFIAPLLLIAFVENTFKHGISTHEVSPILIEISLEKNLFSFKTKNRIFKHKNQDSVGIGLENTRKRLQLIYPENHKLIISETANMFNVELLITL
ncbi:MAG: sensor histidine kinase [Bacteroidetes bacterium]|nr:sensor histidine kinase [Bacteroidota bacterium]